MRESLWFQDFIVILWGKTFIVMKTELILKRDIINDLVNWKEKPDRKPLILEGARQVGKTYAIKQFAKDHYEDLAYINFEQEKSLRGIFKPDFNTERLLRIIRSFTNTQCIPGKTLIFLDEIQEAEGGVTALKYFCENQPDQHIVVAGSLLGIQLHKGVSFPVGKVNMLKMYPMSFLEFLCGVGENGLAEAIKNKDWATLEFGHEKLTDWLRQYLFVGGMPEAVCKFVEKGTLQEVRTIQQDIISGYEKDFSKHAPASLVPRIEQVWHSLPRQLSRENRKFLFGLVKEGARAREYELALKWLQDAGLIYQIFNVDAPRLPLKSYKDDKAFKIFTHDVGLLGALSELGPMTMLNGSDIFVEFKGALSEQFALQELLPNHNLYYWAKPNSTQEIDFLLQLDGKVMPLEIKSDENLKSKSLKTFMAENNITNALRGSMRPYCQQANLTNYPLYALCTI